MRPQKKDARGSAHNMRPTERALAQRGRTVLKALLVLSIICVFAFLYSLIREPFSNRRHDQNLDMTQVHFLFACMLLLLLGMPILR